MTVQVPETHQDLVSDQNKVLAILSTIMPDGSPQATPVWFDMEDGLFRVNTARGRVKDRNIQLNPAVCLTIMDPRDHYHWLMVRGVVMEQREDGAEQHIADLAYKYRGERKFNVPEGDVRVMYMIKPRSIVSR